MKILLLGKNGQVGWELQRALQPLGEVIALDRRVDNTTGWCGDITDFGGISKAIQEYKPNVVVNATAYTAVDKAESEQQQADLINHLAVKNLADCCKKIDALIIHYSTDYVFDGQGDISWQEDNKTNPVNFYGKSKRDGEIALEQSGVKFINFRTSWVYASRGKNFIKTMLMLAKTKEQLTIIDDQIGTPTSAALIADVTAQALRYYDLMPNQQNDLLGHYHLVPNGITTWYEFANLVFELAKKRGEILTIQQVTPITTADYPTPAKRPLNSRLNNTKIQSAFKLHLPNWQQGVEQVVIELIEKNN